MLLQMQRAAPEGVSLAWGHWGPARSTRHGASWSTCDPHKLGKALSEADPALGLSKECPPPTP